MAENRQRGLLKVAANLNGIEPVVETSRAVFTTPSSGFAEAASSVAGDFARIGNQVGKLADQAAAREGKEAGHLAGMDPEFRPQNAGTIRSEAFDRAGLETYLSRTRVAISNDIEAASLKFSAPDKLKAALDEKRGAWLANVPAEVRPEVTTLFEKGSAAAFRHATRELWSRQAAEQRASVQAELGTLLRTIHQRAFGLGLDPTADKILADDEATMRSLLTRRGPDGKPLVDPASAERLILSAREEVATARLYGAFERLPSLTAKAEMIKTLEADFAASRGLAASFDHKTFESVRRHLETELRRDAATERTGTRTLSLLVDETHRRALKGEAVNLEELAVLDSRVATAGTPELADKLADARDTLTFMRDLRRFTVTELEVGVAELRRAHEASPPALADRGRSSRRLEAAERLLTSMQTELKTNPLGWDNRVGMITLEPMAIDPANPAATAAWGARRTAQAIETARRHRLAAPTYLQPVEARSLQRAFEQGGDNGLAVMAAVTTAFGDKAEAVLMEIGRKTAPVGAALGRLSLAVGPTAAVHDAAEGLALRARPDFKPLAPPEPKSRSAADGVLAGALGEAPEVERAAIGVANAIYETRAHRMRLTEFDENAWKQALREAVGQRDIDGVTYGGVTRYPGWWGGHAVIVPPDIRQDRFGAIVQAITPEDLKLGAMHGNGVPLTQRELRSARLVTIEPGRYWLALGDPKGGEPNWVMGPDRKHFVLDFHAALPAVLRRRPDLR